MEGKYTGKRLVHSDAEIEARVWYSKSKKESFIQEEKQLTGNSEKKYNLDINNFKINFYKSIPKFENYDTINESKKIKLFSNLYFPIKIESCNYIETRNIKKEYTYEELKNKIIEELKEIIISEIGDQANIINIQTNEKNIENSLEIEMIYEVIEKIGVVQKIEEENIMNTEE